VSAVVQSMDVEPASGQACGNKQEGEYGGWKQRHRLRALYRSEPGHIPGHLAGRVTVKGRIGAGVAASLPVIDSRGGTSGHGGVGRPGDCYGIAFRDRCPPTG
jgi:hypothetical protein